MADRDHFIPRRDFSRFVSPKRRQSWHSCARGARDGDGHDRHDSEHARDDMDIPSALVRETGRLSSATATATLDLMSPRGPGTSFSPSSSSATVDAHHGVANVSELTSHAESSDDTIDMTVQSDDVADEEGPPSDDAGSLEVPPGQTMAPHLGQKAAPPRGIPASGRFFHGASGKEISEFEMSRMVKSGKLGRRLKIPWRELNKPKKKLMICSKEPLLLIFRSMMYRHVSFPTREIFLAWLASNRRSPPSSFAQLPSRRPCTSNGSSSGTSRRWAREARTITGLKGSRWMPRDARRSSESI